MRLSIFLLLTCSLQLFAVHTEAQNAIVRIEARTITVGELLREIENQTDYLVVFRNKEVDTNQRIRPKTTRAEVSTYLNDAFSNTDIDYHFENNYIILMKKEQTGLGDLPGILQNSHRITGTVLDNQGEPVIGANVVEKGTTNGTTTDINGSFSLSVADNATLQVTYIGYMAQEIRLSGQKTISILLREDSQTLDEVVVVGYGTQKKVNLTGAIGNVNMQEVASRPITNAGNVLQGKVSGVYAMQQSGKPGDDGAIINVRGVGTLNNSDPLILIDGFPGSMNDVNPLDIESVSVLKDASSASIYGNRAANGVILITTKRGDNQKVKVSYSGYFGFESPTRLPEVLNAYDYAVLHNEFTQNAGMLPTYTDEMLAKIKAGNDPLFPDESGFDRVYGNATMHNHHVNLTGGSENLNYAFMLGYLDQDGIMIKTDYKRYTFRSNFDTYFFSDKRLRLSAKFSGDRGIKNSPTGYSDIRMNATFASLIPMKDGDGNWLSIGGEDNFYASTMEGSIRNNLKSHFNALFEGSYTFFDGLSLELSYGFDWVQTKESAFNANVSLLNADGGEKRMASNLNEMNSQMQRDLLNALLRYNKTFGGKHEVSALAGYTEEKFQYNAQNAYRKNFVNNTQPYLNLGDASTMSNNGSAYALGMRSYFGRLGYIFDGKYMLEANLRADGSSRFADGNRWGTFPSFSAGWRISEESFLKEMSGIDNLKLRASWGKLGNQNINSYYAASDILTMGSNYALNGTLQSGVSVNALANKNTTWETTTQTNIGLDLSILGSFNFTLDYFKKVTDDILLQIPIPITMGNLSAPYQNVGKVENRGFEFSGNWNKKLSKDLHISATLNASFIRNEILDLHGRSPIISGMTVLMEGEAIHSFYGYKTDGLYQIDDFTWQNNSDASIPHDERNYTLKEGVVSVQNYTAQPGDLKFKDIDGDKVVTMADDRTVIGKQFPDLTYSLQSNIQWKNFDLGLFFQGIAGMDGYTYQEISTPFSNRSNSGVWWKDRWTYENQKAEYPRLIKDDTRTNLHSDFYVEDASYLRLKNVELGYTIPKQIISKIGIDYVRVYGSVQNAFTITNYKGFDPEKAVSETRSWAFPQVQIVTIGLNVNF
ncbi:TonB-dependent receptor [Parabacteroides sp. OttesenSCG-928-O15]|nr:TonB-dependent receptor [Parabacteroides sp. OttesenSCG-928-O15]